MTVKAKTNNLSTCFFFLSKIDILNIAHDGKTWQAENNWVDIEIPNKRSQFHDIS